jgi:hypothetical protein
MMYIVERLGGIRRRYDMWTSIVQHILWKQREFDWLWEFLAKASIEVEA